jgi:hypothetical protein
LLPLDRQLRIGACQKANSNCSACVGGGPYPRNFGVDELTEDFGSCFSGMDIPVLRFAARRAPGGVIAQRSDSLASAARQEVR